MLAYVLFGQGDLLVELELLLHVLVRDLVVFDLQRLQPLNQRVLLLRLLRLPLLQVFLMPRHALLQALHSVFEAGDLSFLEGEIFR